MRRLTILSLGLVSVSSLLGHKYEPINTEYAPPVEIFILDLTPQYFDVSESEDLYVLPRIGLEIPIATWSQMEVSVPYLLLHPSGSQSRKGFGDLKLGFRTFLPKPSRGPILAFNLELLAPTGDSQDHLAGKATEVSAGLFATQELRRTLLFGNLSYAAEFPKEEHHHENLLEYAAAAVFHLNRFLHPTVEIFGDSNLTVGRTELFLAPEMIIDLTPRLELKWALPIGLTNSSPDWGLQFQFTLFLTKHPDRNLPRTTNANRQWTSVRSRDR